jgi:flagellar biosynthesis/type III secretory pathway chaperone
MKTLDRLINILVAETDLAQALLVVIEEKQLALIQMNAERLAAMVDRERKLLKPTRDLERERLKLLSEIASDFKDLNSTPGQVSLSDLIRHYDGDSAKRLTSHRENMIAVARKIQTRNHQNRILLENSSRFVKNTIHILTGDSARQLVDQKI